MKFIILLTFLFYLSVLTGAAQNRKQNFTDLDKNKLIKYILNEEGLFSKIDESNSGEEFLSTENIPLSYILNKSIKRELESAKITLLNTKQAEERMSNPHSAIIFRIF